MAHLSLRLLGPFQATLDGEAIAGRILSKERALLAYLAVETSQLAGPSPRTLLAGLLWPNRPERAALASLRTALASLRAVLRDRETSPPLLQVTRETIQLDPAGDHWLDVAEFWALVGDGEAERPAHERLEEAIALYRGDFLAGFSVVESPEFEDWTLLMRERLLQQVLDAMRRLAGHHEGRGEFGRACEVARRRVELAPWEEEAHRALMRVLAQSGQRGAALAQYETCRQALVEELGVEPGPETTALYEQIRDGLAQSKTQEAEEGKAGEQARTNNLPAQLTPFIGRKALLTEIEERLLDPGCRLLTLVGPGGSGKTRLAQEAAARHVAAGQVERYLDGVFFVALAPLQSVEAIVPTIAQTIGFSFSGGGAPKEQVLRHLSGKKMLLVLDNYEHLLEGAKLVPEILQRAPGIKILATSRSGLHVQGEYRFPVSGMSYPALSQAALPLPTADGRQGEGLEYSAVRLFLEGARRAQPGPKLADDNLADVARICRLVDGTPLAILLASAWVEMLTPAEIAAELEEQMAGLGLDLLASDLRETPERHSSVRAVFDHSWKLLAERERTVMRALSVYRGGFTRAAAQEVTGASLHALRALVKWSLLRRAPTGRYEIHELLRQYAAEKLALAGDDETLVRDRHCAYYVAALQGWASDLQSPRQLVAIREIRADVDNIRVAWEWAVGSDQGSALDNKRVEWVDRALTGLCLFYEWDSRFQEGEAACRSATEQLAEPAPHPADEGLSAGRGPSEKETSIAKRLRVLAHALAWQGRFSFVLGRSQAADRCYERALAALDRAAQSDPTLDLRRERALILARMSRRAMYTDLEAATQLAEQSLELYRALDDRPGMAESLQTLGAALWRQGDFVGSRERFEENLSLERALGDRRGMVWPLIWLSAALVYLGRFEDATRVSLESVAIAQQVGDPGLVEWAQGCLADALRSNGRFAETGPLLEGYLAYGRERGDSIAESWAWWDLAAKATHLESYEEARSAARLALSVSEASGNQEVAAQSRMELGRLALAEGAYGAAQEWLQQSVAVYERVGGMYWIVGEALAALACAAWGLGQPAQAEEQLGQALSLAFDTHNTPTALYALPAAALLRLDGPGGLGQPDIEGAIELYALASRYPFVANSSWFEDVVGREIAAAAKALPSEIVAHAQERGRARDLWATVEELLEELGGSPPG